MRTSNELQQTLLLKRYQSKSIKRQQFPSIFFLLLLLSGLSVGTADVINANDLVTDQNNHSFYLKQIDAEEFSPLVFSPGTEVRLKYQVPADVTEVYMILNGSNFMNETVAMSYFRFEDGSPTYDLEFFITGYTIFRAYYSINNFNFTEDFEGNLGINYHRLWTTTDHYPELLQINGNERPSSREDLDTEFVVSKDQIEIRYRMTSLNSALLSLIWGYSQSTLNMSTPFSYNVTSSEYFTNVSVVTNSFRELWFYVNSTNSFELNTGNPQFLKVYRITNGIIINSTSFYTTRDENVKNRITEFDAIKFNVTTLNETGNERLVLDVQNQILPSSTSVSSVVLNGTLITTYHYEFDSLTWNDQFSITVSLVDLFDTSQLVAGRKATDIIIDKYGVVIEVEGYQRYTNRDTQLISFIINDLDQGIENITVYINNTSRSLSLNSRSVELDIVEGNNSITISVTNAANELNSIDLFVFKDITRPNILDLSIFKTEDDIYIFVARISEVAIYDTTIVSIDVTINNILYHETIGENSKIHNIYRQFSPRHGNNLFEIYVTDIAGNFNTTKRNHTISLTTSEQIEEGFLEFPISILLLIGCLIVNVVHNRRKSK